MENATNPLAPAPDIGRILAESWAILKANWQILIGANLIILLIGIGIECIPVLGQIAGFILFGPVWSGVSGLTLKLVRKQPVTLSDAFAGFGPHFVPLMVCGMLFQVFVLIGLFLLIVPGIYLAVSWVFPFLLIMDRGQRGWEAMETSRKTVGPYWFSYFGFWIVVLGVLIAGALMLGVGLLIAFPFINNMFAVAYRDAFDSQGGR